MTTSIFEEIKKDPNYNINRSIEWFSKKIKLLSSSSPVDKSGLYNSTRQQQSAKILPGTMVFFGYDPKHKEDLPYYDKFPLSFVFSLTDTGFIGINFHYLPLPIRVKLFDKMWSFASNSRLPSQQVLTLNWQLLGIASRFPEVRPAVKQYLVSHVTTRFLKVYIEDWKTAIMLPNQQFGKQSYQTVTGISKQLMTRYMSH